jgi:polygalacturonase
MKQPHTPTLQHFRTTTLILALAATLCCLNAQANPTLPTIPAGTFNITSYGASTSSANNATAIQNAINAASTAGGGTVQVPAGTFLSGPITLKAKINLNLATGATLKMLAYGTYPGSTPFISGGSIQNVEISGSGTIDGQGSAWWTAYNANNSLARPGVISLDNDTYVEITGIKMINAPNVHISLHYTTSQVTISHITISAPSTSPNTDGVDIEGNNVLFDTDNIACGDDNIAIVGSHVHSQYYVVQNCTFGVGHGMSIGSYTSDQVDHLTVQNCAFNGTTSGIRVKSGDGRGGVVQYLTYTGLTMSNVGAPIYISEWYPSEPSNPTTAASNPVTSTTPNDKHILIQNLTATGASTAKYIYGVPELHISDVVLDNVKITSTTGMGIYYADNIRFTNGSSVTVSSGNPVTVYDATVTGTTTHTYP